MFSCVKGRVMWFVTILLSDVYMSVNFYQLSSKFKFLYSGLTFDYFALFFILISKLYQIINQEYIHFGLRGGRLNRKLQMAPIIHPNPARVGALSRNASPNKLPKTAPAAAKQNDVAILWNILSIPSYFYFFVQYHTSWNMLPTTVMPPTIPHPMFRSLSIFISSVSD